MDKEIKAAEKAIAAHAEAMRLDLDGESESVGVFHLLASLIEYCDTYAIDMDVEIENARHFVRSKT